MHISDLMRQALIIEGYGSLNLSTNDLVLNWLETTTLKTGQVDDLWEIWLELQGFTGQRSVALYDYLGSLGFTGDLSDRIYKWWHSRANP